MQMNNPRSEANFNLAFSKYQEALANYQAAVARLHAGHIENESRAQHDLSWEASCGLSTIGAFNSLGRSILGASLLRYDLSVGAASLDRESIKGTITDLEAKKKDLEGKRQALDFARQDLDKCLDLCAGLADAAIEELTKILPPPPKKAAADDTGKADETREETES